RCPRTVRAGRFLVPRGRNLVSSQGATRFSSCEAASSLEEEGGACHQRGCHGEAFSPSSVLWFKGLSGEESSAGGCCREVFDPGHGSGCSTTRAHSGPHRYDEGDGDGP
ncbi:hypothetical protein A2U01_0067022, partial [Trifolium medium]|nr:hypothetical protein [Trifolium medium]